MRSGRVFDYWISHKGRGNITGQSLTSMGCAKVVAGLLHDGGHAVAVDWLKQEHTSRGPDAGTQGPAQFLHGGAKYEHTFDEVRVKYPESAFHLDDKPKWYKETGSTPGTASMDRSLNGGRNSRTTAPRGEGL